MNLSYSIKCFLLFILIAGIFLLPRATSAQEMEQVARSKIEGTIQDTNKEPIPEVKIGLKHIETGLTFKSESNKKGEFLFSSLPPGKYSFLIEKAGYQNKAGEFELLPNTLKKLQIFLDKEETPEHKQEREAISFFDEGAKLAGENKLDQAIQAFQKAVELKPDFAEAYLNIGILCFQQQKDDEAEKALLKANELKPDEPKAKQILADIYYEKSKTLIQSEKTDEALEKLKQAYSLNSNHAYVNYLLGILYTNKEMKEEARIHLEIFLKLDPKSPLAEKAKQILESLKNKFYNPNTAR